MAELYTVSRYLQPQRVGRARPVAVRRLGRRLRRAVSELEQDAAGGYKPVSRFAKFVNVAELSAMVRQVMDVVTSQAA
jgi:N12 class adenine-specific DNA methylase